MDQKNILTQALKFIQAQKRRRWWLRAVTGMAAVVVFVTTYLLILPAITMENRTFWEDGGHEAERPESIVVQLLCGGKVYDTVTLSQDNSWRYQWENLSAGCAWSVVEKTVPDGYTVTVDRQGLTFLVTNTCGEEQPEEPGEPEEPDTPDEPDTPEEPETPGGQDEPKLPQTGLLWWPVPLLACCGLLLFLIGWKIRRNDEK